MWRKQSILITCITLISLIWAQFAPQAVHASGRIISVVGWGANWSGQTDVPSRLSNVTAIAAGSDHSLALKSDGTVVAWGANWYGQTDVPPSLYGVSAIAAGGGHSLALSYFGDVVAWGANWYGQADVPLSLYGVSAIAAGGDHSLALDYAGTVVAWGDNSSGQTNIPSRLSGVIAIAAGGNHSLALKSNGTVVVWGDNSSGQTNVPSRLSDVIAIAAGGNHSLALKSNGTIVAWGNNWYDQTNVPSRLSGVISIAAGGSHSLAIISTPMPVNTSFESGAKSWNQRSVIRSNIIQYIPPRARTGSWLAILGDYPNENMTLSQRVYVPPKNSTLTFYYKVESTESCGRFYDTARIYLGSQLVWSLDACRYQVSPAWRLARINLRRFAGQYVALRFNMTTNDTNHSAWFIDDIGWR